MSGLDRGGFFVKGGENSMNQDEMVTRTIIAGLSFELGIILTEEEL